VLQSNVTEHECNHTMNLVITSFVNYKVCQTCKYFGYVWSSPRWAIMFWYGTSKWLLSDSKPILYAEAKFTELLHPVVSTPRSGSNSDNGSQRTWSKVSSNSHTRLPVISLPIFSGNVCDWPHSRDTSNTCIIWCSHV